MMKILIADILICSIFLSCQSCTSNSTIDEISLKEQEIQLITQLLPTLIGPNSFPPGPPPDFNPAVETREQYKEKLRESFQKHLERIADSTFTLTFTNVLETVSGNQIARINDTSIGDLGNALLSDTIGLKTIDLEKIAPLLPYQLVDESKKWGRNNITYRGAVSFSRIAFDKNYTKALFRFDFSCKFDCGWGAFVIAEKINGQWQVQKKYSLWVN